MTKFQLLSDLHLESNHNFQSQILPKLKSDADYLILAGDICGARNYEKYSWFFKWCSENYKKTYYTLGNHEHYNSYKTSLLANPTYKQGMKTDEAEKLIPFFLFIDLVEKYNLQNLVCADNFEPFDDNDEFVLLGSTTWTNYNNGDPLLMLDAESMMNDKRAGELTAAWCYDQHKYSMEALKSNLQDHKDKKVIVVTHHPITTRYLEHSKFKGDKLNGAFCSDYDQLILDNPQIKHVCSGHTHEKWAGTIGQSQYHINPLGYRGEIAGEYTPYTFTI